MTFVLTPTSPIRLGLASDLYVSPLSPLILTPDDDTVLISRKPYVATLNLGYTRPLLGIHTDINGDPRVQRKIVKFFQMKTLDKWLFEELMDILNYFKIDNKGYVDVLGGFNEYKPSVVQQEIMQQLEKKVDFIEKYFLTSSVVHRILDRYTKENGVEWVHLPRHQHAIKQLIGDKLMSLIKTAISSKK